MKFVALMIFTTMAVGVVSTKPEDGMYEMSHLCEIVQSLGLKKKRYHCDPDACLLAGGYCYVQFGTTRCVEADMIADGDNTKLRKPACKGCRCRRRKPKKWKGKKN
jgi:hypothetical protein